MSKKLDKLQKRLYYDNMVQRERLAEAGSIFDSFISKIDKALQILNSDGNSDRKTKGN